MMNNEFKAIAELFQQRAPFVHPLTITANGDDASVHRIPENMELVISSDSAVSGIHWPDDMPLDIAANRAVNAALSDLAAMGAQATWLWLAVMARDGDALSRMSDGLVEACLEHHVELAGGDTVRSPTNAINVTVAGLLPKGSAMRRSAARVDDEIWLLGDPGLAALGLEQWQAGLHQGDHVASFCHVKPQLANGLVLNALGVQCCMDVSDGLLQDAGHIASASQVSMCFELEKLTSLASYQELLQATNQDKALQLTLNGGEDYALLFTAPVSMQEKLLELGAKSIGYCSHGNEVKLLSSGKEIAFQQQGFDHFA